MVYLLHKVSQNGGEKGMVRIDNANESMWRKTNYSMYLAENPSVTSLYPYREIDEDI